MSNSWPQRSAGVGAGSAGPGPDERKGGPAGTPAHWPGEYNGRPRSVPDLPHTSNADQDWAERVEREARHQEVIEAIFDRAEAYERLGDFERALEWLDRAAAVSGGLPAAYRARRARWAREASVRPHPASGDWTNPAAAVWGRVGDG